MSMRRQDREITDPEQLLDILHQCDVCRLALNDPSGYPYLLPLNFGLEQTPEGLVLYFHGADRGTKYDLLARDNRVSFELDCAHRLVYNRQECHCTMEYQSVIGRGRLTLVETEEEKLHGLQLLMDHYHPQGDAPFSLSAMPRTAVLRLDVAQMTGKARLVRPKQPEND